MSDENPASRSDEQAPVETAGATIYFPQVLCDMYGVSLSEARRMIAASEIKIDGEPYLGDAFDMPLDLIEGRRIVLSDGIKTYALTYQPQRDRFFG